MKNSFKENLNLFIWFLKLVYFYWNFVYILEEKISIFILGKYRFKGGNFNNFIFLCGGLVCKKRKWWRRVIEDVFVIILII